MSEETTENKKETTAKKRATRKTATKKPLKTVKADYPKKEDGSVDWFAIIPEKFIVAQDKSKSNIPISELKDNEKMVLLGGWKHLLKERGYISKQDIIHCASPDFVSATCRIVWQPHEDSDGIEQMYEASADAHEGNTDSFIRPFLTACAQNRAFARCVREYLNIHVVGKDETSKASIEDLLSMTQNDKSGAISNLTQGAHTALKNKLEKIGKNIQDAKKWLIVKEMMSKEEASNIKNWNDIPIGMCYTMINYLAKLDEKSVKELKDKEKEKETKEEEKVTESQ